MCDEKVFYEVIAYTGRWAHRRLYFNDYPAAYKYAENELENDDVLEVWITTISAERTGSFGALEIISNMPILCK